MQVGEKRLFDNCGLKILISKFWARNCQTVTQPYIFNIQEICIF